MPMTPLIDADILRYEVGFAAEYGWQATNEEGEKELPPFDYVAEMLDSRIANICAEVYATEKPILFLTGKGNFRDEIATVKPYKDNRKKSKKPWHFKNITAYMKSQYEVIEAVGMEADDLICIEQIERLAQKDTIICTRDKDLRQCPGFHFGWELGNQPSFGPEWVDEMGWIKINEKRSKVWGTGLKFFYAQMIVGDSTDNIPGLPRGGPGMAFDILNECETEEELHKAVSSKYKDKYEEEWQERMLEQGQLLWMVRQLDKQGKPVMWRLYREEI